MYWKASCRDHPYTGHFICGILSKMPQTVAFNFGVAPQLWPQLRPRGPLQVYSLWGQPETSDKNENETCTRFRFRRNTVSNRNKNENES